MNPAHGGRAPGERGTDMVYRGWKLHIMIIAFVACLAAAFGVQRLAYSHRVAAPLEQEFLRLEGVTGVSLADEGDRTDVILHVEPDTDVPKVYREAQRLGRTTLGASMGEVRLVDRRTPELTAAFYALHLALHEGAATGRFTLMERQLEAVLPELPVDDARVFVDDRYVYVVIVHGDAYLYELIARPETGTGARGPGA